MKCEVAHVYEKIILGTAKEMIRTEGREDSPQRTVRGTGKLSASELIICVHTKAERSYKPEGRHGLSFTLLSSTCNPKHPAEVCVASYPSPMLFKAGSVDCKLNLMVIHRLLEKI